MVLVEETENTPNTSPIQSHWDWKDDWFTNEEKHSGLGHSPGGQCPQTQALWALLDSAFLFEPLPFS